MNIESLTKPLAIVSKKVLLLFSVLLLIALSLPLKTFAQDVECNERMLRDRKISILSCEDQQTNCSVSNPNGSGPLIGSDNIEKIFQYFLGRGLTVEQAAGVAGNAWMESGGDPNIVHDRGLYHGIFQWDKDDRWPRLLKWTQQQGMDHTTLEAQLDYAWHEATERGDIEGMKEQQTVELAAWYWGRFFEGAVTGGGSTEPMTNVQHLDRRVDFANQVLTLYGDAAGSVSSPGQNCANNTAGENTQFVDGFTIYSQYDPAWKDLPYSSSTIGVSGCGPAAMAMIITALTGNRVTPVDTANYAASQGMYVPGSGSSWSIGPVVAEHWGLQSEPVAKNVAAITAALQQGKLVITPGGGPKPFTSRGHFIVIRGVTESGMFLVGDSGHSDTSDKEWDPQQIVNSMRDGGSYAIWR